MSSRSITSDDTRPPPRVPRNALGRDLRRNVEDWDQWSPNQQWGVYELCAALAEDGIDWKSTEGMEWFKRTLKYARGEMTRDEFMNPHW